MAYAQYVNQHSKPPNYGMLMRVLPGTFLARPADFGPLVNADGSYCCFWMASWELGEGRIRIATNATIPKQHRKMPMFKWGIASLKTGRVGTWQIWNGKTQTSKPTARLTAEQRDFPLLQLVPLEVVTWRIERGWHPKDACRGDTGLPFPPGSAVSPKAKRTPPHKCSVSLFENDATWDAWGEIKDEGLRYVRAAITDARRLANRGDLDREPANAILAIAAIVVIKRGYVPQELRTGHDLDEVVDALSSTLNSRLLNDLIHLVEEVRLHSEVQELWKDQGLEREWSRKVGTLLRRLKLLASTT